MFDLFGNINKLRNIHSDSEKKEDCKIITDHTRGIRRI